MTASVPQSSRRIKLRETPLIIPERCYIPFLEERQGAHPGRKEPILGTESASLRVSDRLADRASPDLIGLHIEKSAKEKIFAEHPDTSPDGWGKEWMDTK